MLKRVTQKHIDGVAALVREYHSAENDPKIRAEHSPR